MATGKRAANCKRFHLTKEFLEQLKTLKSARSGVVKKAYAAVLHAQNEGTLSLKVTNYGEDRIPNCEKYDLGGGYRLVVQYSESAALFVFIGTHEETDHWLDINRDKRWVVKGDNQTAFVPISQSTQLDIGKTVNLDLSKEIKGQPLLRVPTEKLLSLGFTPDIVPSILAVTPEKWEESAEQFIDHIQKECGDDRAALLIDLFSLAIVGKHSDCETRIQVYLKTFHVATPQEFERALSSTANSEIILDLSDPICSDQLSAEKDLTDWMLFLHPDQKLYSQKDLAGPARLRGISGSGKTCVLVHRARYLAKKYKKPVKIITLTQSMRNLIELLCHSLCGVESRFISVSTVWSFNLDLLEYLDAGLVSSMNRRISDEVKTNLVADSANLLARHPDFGSTGLGGYTERETYSFLKSEIEYVRSRLLDADLASYLDGKAFSRRGRGKALTEVGRKVVYEGIRHYKDALDKIRGTDFEGVTQYCYLALRNCRHEPIPFRCILIDEVQDLTQMEINVLSELCLEPGNHINDTSNGLFLVGDGTQAIYGRGFTLRQAGIRIANRGYVLTKNYRNSIEILQAAYKLVENYEFADTDEDEIRKPIEPGVSGLRGPAPQIVKCRSLEEEGEFIASQVIAAVSSAEISPGQICILGPSRMREFVGNYLHSHGVAVSELRDDVDFESNSVKLSTIESAKGHEFSSVLIGGMNEGFLPRYQATKDEVAVDASKLYVGMTRARKYLTISYSTSGSNLPSQYLLSIQPFCQEFELRDTKLTPLRS